MLKQIRPWVLVAFLCWTYARAAEDVERVLAPRDVTSIQTATFSSNFTMDPITYTPTGISN